MITDVLEQVESGNPVSQIEDRELDTLILKIGSFLSIVNNKKINQAKLLITVLKNKKFQDCAFRLTEFDNLKCFVECLIEKYPTLCKSKVVTKAVKKKYGKPHVSRKRGVQQVPVRDADVTE